VAVARFSIARLGISWAPIWTGGMLPNADGSFRYDLVPSYGATRFSLSAAFGTPGLTLLSGHDDIGGDIFRQLGALRSGDAIIVWTGHHTYHYVVRSTAVVLPGDVRLLNRPRSGSTLALVTCTPYMVDTHRIIVLADLQ